MVGVEVGVVTGGQAAPATLQCGVLRLVEHIIAVTRLAARLELVADEDSADEGKDDGHNDCDDKDFHLGACSSWGLGLACLVLLCGGERVKFRVIKFNTNIHN